MESLDTYLKGAEKQFRTFIKAIDPSISRWIQYRGFEVEGSYIVFVFKSSQNSLTFKVRSGVKVGDIEFILHMHSNMIYLYFRGLKYTIIDSKTTD